jgi:hypothetical protein
MRSILLWGLPILFFLHQDFWLWDRTDLVFGFLPIGLAYHAFYTLLVFVWMALLVKFAWPKEFEEQPTEGGTP